MNYEEESLKIQRESLDILKSMFKVSREANIRLQELLQKID